MTSVLGQSGATVLPAADQDSKPDKRPFWMTTIRLTLEILKTMTVSAKMRLKKEAAHFRPVKVQF